MALTSSSSISSAILFVGLTGCYTAEIQQLETDRDQLKGKVVGLQDQVGILRADHERLIIELSCKNQQVVDFLRDCKDLLSGGESASCNKLNVEQAMKAMAKEKHVLVRVKPAVALTSAVSMTTGRKRQIEKMVGLDSLKTISDVLVITQPQSNSPEHGNEADHIGRLTKKYLNEELHVPAAKLFGPLRITCRDKSQMMDYYANQTPEDRPDFDEPQGRASKVGVWVFRLDCGNVGTSHVDPAQRNPPGGSVGTAPAARGATGAAQPR